MHTYIMIHHTQTTLDVALFLGNSSIDHRIIDKRLTSKLLIPTINDLLHQRSIALHDVLFIGINQGPGMFSTLRAIIATVNGIHCATNIPLIGIDALAATALEFSNPTFAYTLTLFNACNNELYYALTTNNNTLSTGYGTLDTIISLTENTIGIHPVCCIGDGTALYKEMIAQDTRINAHIPHVIPHLCSLNMLAQCALEKYLQTKGNGYLLPLHLKKHAVER